MSSVISLEEAARRTGLTRRQVGDKVAEGKLSIERDPVTGEKGIYPHTLRGVNGYQPPEPPPAAKPPPPPPPKPEPWIPGPAEMAALIKLDGHARAVAMADLVRQHPHLRAWFRDNPLPQAFRRPPPPPPPQARPEPTPPPPKEPPPVWRTSWQFELDPTWQAPPTPPQSPPKPVPPRPPEATPRPETPPVLVTPPAVPENVGRLFIDVLWLALAGLVRNTGISLRHASRTGTRLAMAVVGVATLAGVYFVMVALLSHNRPPPVRLRPATPHVSRPSRHHPAPPAASHVKRPPMPISPPYPLPPLLPPGAGRQDPAKPK